jgi:hypothetical protein
MIYAISFRIEEVGDHYERYKSLIDAISKEAVSYTSDETTSLVIIESSKSTSDLTSSLYLRSSITRSDLLLVINLSEKSYDKRGVFKHGVLLDALMARR